MSVSHKILTLEGGKSLEKGQSLNRKREKAHILYFKRGPKSRRGARGGSNPWPLISLSNPVAILLCVRLQSVDWQIILQVVHQKRGLFGKRKRNKATKECVNTHLPASPPTAGRPGGKSLQTKIASPSIRIPPPEVNPKFNRKSGLES